MAQSSGNVCNTDGVVSEPSSPVSRLHMFAFMLCGVILLFVFLEDRTTTLLRRQTVIVGDPAPMRHYMDRSYCNVNCPTGTPCSYNDELDFRIIVITFNRPESLAKCLEKIYNLDTLGDKVGVDIWIDRSRDGIIDKATLNVSRGFQNSWKQGRACVHQHNKNANISRQWIDSWRPRADTSELALILEDDIDISPLAYMWLKHMHGYFHNWTNIAGYTLQIENAMFVGKGNRTTASGPKSDAIYLCHLLGTWGFAPFPAHWRKFQDWYHVKHDDVDFHPYVDGIVTTDFFKSFEKKGEQDNLFEMWPIYYFSQNNLFVVRPNLQKFSGRMDVLLDTNRLEIGLHFHRKRNRNHTHLLLREWDPLFDNFPRNITRYDLFGKIKAD